MSLTKVSLTATAVLVLGVTAPGCALPAPDAARGTLCASPAEGGEFCVSSGQGPGAAWSQAAAHGSMPIQMWAKWPSDVALDDLIQSQTKLKAWFADVDTVISYVRDTQRSAESYQATLNGNLLALLRQVKERQAESTSWVPVDPIRNVRAALSNKASAEKGAPVAAAALDNQSMLSAQAILDKAKADAAPFAASYASIVADFTAYRATEAAETAAYASLAGQASQGTLATLPDLTQAVLTAAKSASATPTALYFKTINLGAWLRSFELDAQRAIQPSQDFLATHGAKFPDMTSTALRSLNAMLGYIQQRIARSDATAIMLLDGIAMRKQALTLLSMGQPFRDKVAQVEMLRAGAVFKADADARVAAFAAGPPMSTTMKLPYLAARYDQLTRMLQMEPLCDPASSSWREDGCSMLRGGFPDAKTYLKTTLPALIQAGIATMRAQGVDAMLLDAAQAKLDAGDVKSAAIAYDAAVRSTEGT